MLLQSEKNELNRKKMRKYNILKIITKQKMAQRNTEILDCHDLAITFGMKF